MSATQLSPLRVMIFSAPARASSATSVRRARTWPSGMMSPAVKRPVGSRAATGVSLPFDVSEDIPEFLNAYVKEIRLSGQAESATSAPRACDPLLVRLARDRHVVHEVAELLDEQRLRPVAQRLVGPRVHVDEHHVRAGD